MGYRDYKQFAPNTLHHIYNRGNAKMDIFLDDEDYRWFLKRLKILLSKEPLTMVLIGKWKRSQRLTPFPLNTFSPICYCLMPNHFHFVFEQKTELPLSLLLLKLCTGYAKYFNRKYNRVGHVFQDQFNAVMITNDQQLSAVSAYIHQNPKAADLVQDAADWAYSSYQDYLGMREDSLCEQDWIVRGFRDIAEYREFVEERFTGILERKEIADLMLD
jgi:putative transposase